MSQLAHNTQETKPRAQLADDGSKIKEKNAEDLLNKINRKISQIYVKI